MHVTSSGRMSAVMHQERIFARAQGRSSPPALYASATIHTTSPSAMKVGHGTTSSTPRHSTRTGTSSCATEVQYAWTGREREGVWQEAMTANMYAWDVEAQDMERRTAIAQRRIKALMPYKPDAWTTYLQKAGLLQKYGDMPEGLQRGFVLRFPKIRATSTPLNTTSVQEHHVEFNEIIQKEIQKGRYMGPMVRKEVEKWLGPFQSLPFSVISKAGKTGKFRIIQNLSFLPPDQQGESVNSRINSDKFPYMWGTFVAVAQLVAGLPPGLQMVVQDVAEAYRTVPLHKSQWPAVVVKTGDN